MPMTVGQIADQLGGSLHGKADRLIASAGPLDQAGPDQITFLADRKKLAKLSNAPESRPSPGAVLITSAINPADVPCPSIVVDEPLTAILTIAQLLEPFDDQTPTGIDPRAAIDPTAEVAEGCSIGPFAVIEAGVVIGKNCKVHAHAVIRQQCQLGQGVEIHPHAVLYPRCEIGDRSIIHASATIGKDGFGYRVVDGKHQKIPQLGKVVLGQDVEVGANTTIDRATLGQTTIGSGSKIDNQVMVAHNCQIGDHNILVAQAGIAGSSTTGQYVVIAGKAGIADHVTIGNQAVIGANAGVFQDIEDGGKYVGSPAQPQSKARRYYASLMRVPEMRDQLRQLQRDLKALTQAATMESKLESELESELESQSQPLKRAAG